MRRIRHLGRVLPAVATLWLGAVFTAAPADEPLGRPADAHEAARAAVVSPAAYLQEDPDAAVLYGTLAASAASAASVASVASGATMRDVGLPDFTADPDVRNRKEAFFAYLRPLVAQENRRLAAIRERLDHIRAHVRWRQPLAPRDELWLARAAEAYDVSPGELDSSGFWREMFARVDTLPMELVLVQAANESAWGTSRFAREGNNLFGQWCFRQGCGMVPAQRPEGAAYEVARFGSVQESIASYMHNLNTGRPYRRLREIRQRLRSEGREVAGDKLAAGLRDYSERGDDYVDEIRAMIRQNAEVIAGAVAINDTEEEG